ncbi:MAG: DUF2971 domain-containing protein [Moraxellaceae bacterium]|nr:DUF2971 domain-containing protein [Moraxellaceae bacterium]
MNLYHYTDQRGLIGIIGKKELWATKIQYLNDDNEYRLAFKIAEKYLYEKIRYAKTDNIKFRIRRFIANFDSVGDMNICVCSLSENGDLLSQWRGYSTSLGGYSIGFNKETLIKNLDFAGFYLRQCVYLKSEQEEIIHAAIDKVLEEYKDYIEPHQKRNSENCASESSRAFCNALSEISPTIKDQTFSEEREWRVISKGGIHFDKLDFREGRSMLTPYYRIALNINIEDLIAEIIVGHTPNIGLAKSATQAFIYKEFMGMKRYPSLKVSSIPYRKW